MLKFTDRLAATVDAMQDGTDGMSVGLGFAAFVAQCYVSSPDMPHEDIITTLSTEYRSCGNNSIYGVSQDAIREAEFLCEVTS